MDQRPDVTRRQVMAAAGMASAGLILPGVVVAQDKSADDKKRLEKLALHGTHIGGWSTQPCVYVLFNVPPPLRERSEAEYRGYLQFVGGQGNGQISEIEVIFNGTVYLFQRGKGPQAQTATMNQLSEANLGGVRYKILEGPTPPTNQTSSIAVLL